MATRQLRREQTRAYLKELRARDTRVFGGICWHTVKKSKVSGLNKKIEAMIGLMTYITSMGRKNVKK